MTAGAPTPFAALRAVVSGTAPRVFQGRGWAVAGLVAAPVGLSLLISLYGRLIGADAPAGEALRIYHEGLVKVMLPIMALVAAPAWVLPLAKGLPWVAWGALWLVLGTLGLQFVGGDPAQLPGRMLALVGAWWGELALITLAGLVFKRGALWGALYLFLWEPMVRILPPFLQRFTFVHYVESLAGSRAMDVKTHDLLAQAQVATPPVLALLALVAFGALCWALAGWKLHRTPVGLAGSEAEG